MNYPYDYKQSQYLKSDADVAVVRTFVARITVVASKATAASGNGIHAAIALTAATQEITTGITQPSTPRNLSIVGNAAGIAGNVVIHGTNYHGDVISETLALNGTTTVQGAKAFKTVTQIDMPVETHAGTDTVAVGFGEKLGLPYKLPFDTIRGAYLNGVKEGTAPTVTTSTTALESNTFKLNSALNGTQVDVHVLVN